MYSKYMWICKVYAYEIGKKEEHSFGYDSNGKENEKKSVKATNMHRERGRKEKKIRIRKKPSPYTLKKIKKKFIQMEAASSSFSLFHNPNLKLCVSIFLYLLLGIERKTIYSILYDYDMYMYYFFRYHEDIPLYMYIDMYNINSIFKTYFYFFLKTSVFGLH